MALFSNPGSAESVARGTGTARCGPEWSRRPHARPHEGRAEDVGCGLLQQRGAGRSMLPVKRGGVQKLFFEADPRVVEVEC